MALTEIPVELSSTPGIADSSNATAITIDSSEQVGIGTGSPSTSLDIVRAGVQPLRLESSSGTEVAINMVNTGGNVQLEAHSGNFVIDADKVSINAAGASSPAPLQHFQVIHHSGGGRRSTLYYNQDNRIALAALNASSTWEALAIEGASIDLKTGGTTNASALNVDADGYVTMPKQAAFQVRKSSNQDNFSVGSDQTVTWDTEVIDKNSDFGSNSFTAPITGTYFLNTQIRFNNQDSAASYYQIAIQTSNRDYTLTIDPGGFDANNAYWTQGLSVIADMDASDTATVRVRQQGGSAQTDIDSGGSSWFSGHLLS